MVTHQLTRFYYEMQKCYFRTVLATYITDVYFFSLHHSYTLDKMFSLCSFMREKSVSKVTPVFSKE